jgi:hypothetical protein
MNNYQVGDFGKARFKVNKKGCERFITCYGTIKAIEKKILWFCDNDEIDYLVDRKYFEFEVETFNPKI